MSETTIRLGTGSQPEKRTQQSDSPSATLCPACQRHLSPNAQFCPYDGEKLALRDFQSVAEDALIGSTIDDRYEVLAVIGEGGMGRVYRVRHRRLGRSFALKALRLELSTDSTLTQRFIQEARAAAVVSHPNVVQINDFGTLPTGQPYFVMELLEGRTLTRLLREERCIEPLRCVAISRYIAEALGAAHTMGVIHRDLKPDNVIVIRPAGAHLAVKVLDFGLAKVAVNSQLTRPGIVFGTPHYLSPEQAAGEPYDHRVDIYALGVMMFEMVTGRVPFDADTYLGVLSKHLYSAPPRPRDYHAAAGSLPGLEDIISRCLAKNPEERWPTMADVSRNLSALASERELTLHQPLGAQSREPPTRRNRSARLLSWYAAAVSVYVSAGLCLLGVSFFRGSPSAHTAAGTAAALNSSVVTTSVRSAPVAVTAPAMPEALARLPAATARLVESKTQAKGPSQSGQPPPAAKRRLAGSKPAGKNRKRPTLGSGDIADPWAK